jgi:hypothetical protein
MPVTWFGHCSRDYDHDTCRAPLARASVPNGLVRLGKCEVCHLVVDWTSQEVSDADRFHEIMRAPAIAEWRGREDEANGWVYDDDAAGVQYGIWGTAENQARSQASIERQLAEERARARWALAEIVDGSDLQVFARVRRAGHTSRDVPFHAPRYDPETGEPLRARYLRSELPTGAIGTIFGIPIYVRENMPPGVDALVFTARTVDEANAALFAEPVTPQAVVMDRDDLRALVNDVQMRTPLTWDPAEP